MAPICVDCQIEMRPAKNGFVVELMAADRPYQKWSTDKWACPNCSFEVVVGFGRQPLAESWQGSEYESHKTDLRYWGFAKRQADGGRHTRMTDAEYRAAPGRNWRDNWQEHHWCPPIGKHLDLTAARIERAYLAEPCPPLRTPRNVLITWYHVVLQRAELDIGTVRIVERS